MFCLSFQMNLWWYLSKYPYIGLVGLILFTLRFLNYKIADNQLLD